MKKNLRFQMRGEYEKISESCCTAPEDINLSDLSCLAPSILMIYPSDGGLFPPFKAECVTPCFSGTRGCFTAMALWLFQCNFILFC